MAVLQEKVNERASELWNMGEIQFISEAVLYINDNSSYEDLATKYIIYSEVAYRNARKELSSNFDLQSFDHDIEIWIKVTHYLHRFLNQFNVATESCRNGRKGTQNRIQRLIDRSENNVIDITKARAVYLKNPEGCQKLWTLLKPN